MTSVARTAAGQQQVLEHLHVLANYQWDQKPLLSLVLVGLPELWRAAIA
jgi:type II secretory pathway predicted ATPase ExeA